MLLEMRHTRHLDVEIDVVAREKIPQIRNAPRIRGMPLAVLPPDNTLFMHACMQIYVRYVCKYVYMYRHACLCVRLCE